MTTLANISDEVKYAVTCEVLGTADTRVNMGRAPFNNVSAAATCCGSTTRTPGTRLEPTGLFRRSAVGGMLSITNGDAAAKYAPLEVRDLSAGIEQPLYVVADNETSSNQTFQLYFTAPGGLLDSGHVDGITVYFATNQSLLMSSLDLFQQEQLNNSLDLVDPSLLARPPAFGRPICLDVKLLSPSAGGRFTIGQLYYFRLQAVVNGPWSATSLSNIGRLYLRAVTDPDQLVVGGLSGAAMAGIVMAALLSPAAIGKVVINCGVLFFQCFLGLKSCKNVHYLQMLLRNFL